MIARPPRILLALVFSLLFAADGCGKTFSECPSAPIRLVKGDSCDFSARCTYATPVNLGNTGTDYCNDLTCVCDKDSKISCTHTLLSCTPHVLPQCPPATSGGVECSLDPNRSLTNSECAVPGPGADLTKGIINGEVCACDNPGPIWRCQVVDKTDI